MVGFAGSRFRFVGGGISGSQSIGGGTAGSTAQTLHPKGRPVWLHLASRTALSTRILSADKTRRHRRRRAVPHRMADVARRALVAAGAQSDTISHRNDD